MADSPLRLHLDSKEVATAEMGLDKWLTLSERLNSDSWPSLALPLMQETANHMGDMDATLPSLAKLYVPEDGTTRTTYIFARYSDLFLPKSGAIAHVAAVRNEVESSERLTLNLVYRGDKPRDLEDLPSAVLRHAVELGLVEEGSKWSNVKGQTKVPDIPTLTKASTPDETSVAAAKSIAVPATREILRDVKIATLSTTAELTQGGAKPAKVSPEALKHLADSGLLRTEFAVLCRSDSNRVFATASVEAVLQSPDRCLHCGDPINSHRTVEIVTSTDLADRLLIKSRWMTVLALHTLLEYGVSVSNILVPPEDAGSDETDLAFSYKDSPPTIVEMKDSDFGQGDASNFGFRLAQLGVGGRGLILATGRVEEEALKVMRRLLASQRYSASGGTPSVEIKSLQGDHCCTTALTELLEADQLRRAKVRLRLAGPLRALDVSRLLDIRLAVTRPDQASQEAVRVGA